MAHMMKKNKTKSIPAIFLKKTLFIVDNQISYKKNLPFDKSSSSKPCRLLKHQQNLAGCHYFFPLSKIPFQLYFFFLLNCC